MNNFDTSLFEFGGSCVQFFFFSVFHYFFCKQWSSKPWKYNLKILTGSRAEHISKFLNWLWEDEKKNCFPLQLSWEHSSACSSKKDIILELQFRPQLRIFIQETLWPFRFRQWPCLFYAHPLVRTQIHQAGKMDSQRCSAAAFVYSKDCLVGMCSELFE